MKGLELAERYFDAYGRPALEAALDVDFVRIAAGLAGSGSECLGFDDELSQDHDFGAGFCIWLTDKDFDRIGSRAAAAYAELPREFLGYPKRCSVVHGEQRVGVMRLSEHYMKFTGLARAPQTLSEWRRIPEHLLAMAVNGRVFMDGPGIFTAIREELLTYYPEDIRLKKIAARVATSGQSGQYNYARCVKRGESVAAALALAEFIKAVCSLVYLLNKRYMPFYKWAPRGMRDLPILREMPDLIGKLVSLQSVEIAEKSLKRRDVERIGTIDCIELICSLLVNELKLQGLSDSGSDFLLPHGEEIMRRIEDPEIARLHIFAE